MDPVAFHLGDIPIRWYGLCIAIGFLAGYGAMLWRAKKINFPLDQVGDIVFAAVISGLVGARLYYVIYYWDQFRDQPIRMFYIHEGGLVFFGGFIGAAITLIVYSRWKKMDLLTICDLCALGVPLAHTFGRLGCFLNGCCFGQHTEGPLGFRYPANYGHILYGQVKDGLLTPEAAAEMTYCLPVMPVQLFNSGRNLLTFIILMIIARKLKLRGQLFAWFLVFYGVGRFATEFLRGDYERYYLGMTPAQLIAIMAVIAGVAMHLWVRKHPRPVTMETAADAS